jgi:glutamine synthetase
MPLRKHQRRQVAEYIWQDADGNFRSKTKLFPECVWEETMESTPMWHFDGSSTGQATTEDSEIVLKPWFVCVDPHRFLLSKSNMYGKLVFCDLWVPSKDDSGEIKTKEGFSNVMDSVKNVVREEVTCFKYPNNINARDPEVNNMLKERTSVQMDLVPHRDNTREKARKFFSLKKVHEADPWYGFEQEFFFTDLATGKPLGWEECRAECGQEKFYCGVGKSEVSKKVKELADKTLDDIIMVKGHLDCCGLNLEVAPGQCEFQIRGSGLNAADNLTVFRYLLEKRAQAEGYGVTFHPKPLEGKWNGSGCHTNYSCKNMREEGGLEYIKAAIKLLEEKHIDHMDVYGKDNELRMTGECETAKWNEFKWGVADRSASVRIPRNVVVEGCGYLEDRRPASNCDPYLVSMKLSETVVLQTEDWENEEVWVEEEVKLKNEKISLNHI